MVDRSASQLKDVPPKPDWSNADKPQSLIAYSDWLNDLPELRS